MSKLQMMAYKEVKKKKLNQSSWDYIITSVRSLKMKWKYPDDVWEWPTEWRFCRVCVSCASLHFLMLAPWRMATTDDTGLLTISLMWQDMTASMIKCHLIRSEQIFSTHTSKSQPVLQQHQVHSLPAVLTTVCTCRWLWVRLGVLARSLNRNNSAKCYSPSSRWRCMKTWL